MFIDTRDCESNWRDIYKLATTFIQPRPIALVSTLSAEGVPNLAPFSFYNMVSANPPVVMFAPLNRRDGSGKDSLRNAEATAHFVIATVTEDIAERMNRCSYDYPPDVDEFAKSGLSPRPARFVKPSLVAESPVNLECTLEEVKRFGQGPGAGTVVFGRVVAVHVDDDVLAEDGLVDPARLKAIGRMGRSTYSGTVSNFELPRPEKG
jgi:flavin reductase (DIM6/NTAB) family NADH-FMN oxidoreductase RutF